jgi:hypothetical protein
MAIIKCREEDGTLVPSTIEFERGDTIQFESHQPVYVLAGSSSATQALRSFTLSEISVHAKDGSVLVRIPVKTGPFDPDVSRDARIPGPAPVIGPAPDNDPRLPPPLGGPETLHVRPIKIHLPPPSMVTPVPQP